MHEPAVPDRREQDGKRKIEAKNSGAHTAVRKRYCMPRPKGDVAKYPAIFPECDLALSAAIEVIKHRFRHPLARDGPEVLDAHNPGRRHGSRRSCHLHSNIQNLEAARYRTTTRHRTGTEILDAASSDGCSPWIGALGATLSCSVREQTSPSDVPYTSRAWIPDIHISRRPERTQDSQER